MQSPAQFSSPILSKVPIKKVPAQQVTSQKQFRKQVSSGSRNVNHIIQKYDQIQPFTSKKEVQTRARPAQSANVLDSINKNIVKHHKDSQPNHFKMRVTNSGMPVLPRPAPKSTVHASSGGNQHTAKPNKFLVKNNPQPKFERKRNFSPIGGQQHAGPSQIFQKAKQTINVSGNNLGGSQGLTSVDQRADNIGDSLGGGSKINTKTGSMLNFGGGSRVPDNVSVMSR